MGAHIWQGMSMQNACMLLKAVALVVEGGGGGAGMHCWGDGVITFMIEKMFIMSDASLQGKIT